jgi:hypothetical protein
LAAYLEALGLSRLWCRVLRVGKLILPSPNAVSSFVDSVITEAKLRSVGAKSYTPRSWSRTQTTASCSTGFGRTRLHIEEGARPSTSRSIDRPVLNIPRRPSFVGQPLSHFLHVAMCMPCPPATSMNDYGDREWPGALGKPKIRVLKPRCGNSRVNRPAQSRGSWSRGPSAVTSASAIRLPLVSMTIPRAHR